MEGYHGVEGNCVVWDELDENCPSIGVTDGAQPYCISVVLTGFSETGSEIDCGS